MDQDKIKINFKKEETLSVTGNKFILSYNAPLIIDQNNDTNEITIDLEQFSENISTSSFKNFIDASFGNNLKLESREAFEIQLLCQKYGNNSLLSDINEFIEQIPEPQKAIMKFKLNENEDSLKYISNHFPECSKCQEFMDFDPNAISILVISSEDFKAHINSEDYQHALARYLVKINRDNKNIDINNISESIKFEILSPADIQDLTKEYPELQDLASKKASSSIKTIHDIIDQGNQTLESIKTNLDRMINEKNESMNAISNTLNEIDKQKERIFSEVNAQRTRIYYVDTQRDNLNIIQQRYESVNLLYEQVTQYKQKIEKNFTDLASRVSEAEATASNLVSNDSNE